MAVDDVDRRRLLVAFGAATAALAGCSSTGSRDGSPATNGGPATGEPSSGSTTPTRPVPGSTTPEGEPGPVTPDSSVVAWRFDAGREIAVPPGVHDVTVYAGTAGAEAGTPDGGGSERDHGYLFGLTAADGTERWRYETVHNVASRPVVVEDTVVFVTGASGMMITSGWGVTGLTTDGERRWRVSAEPADVLATDDSTVYVAEHEGHYGTDAYPPTAIRALDPADGHQRWRRKFGKFERVRVRNGMLYVGTSRSGRSDAGLSGVDTRSGRTEWSRPDFLLRSVTDDGLFGYSTATEPGRLVRLDSDGSERWSVERSVSDVFAVGDDRVYAAGENAIVAHDAADGTERWRVDVDLDWAATARLAAGTLYVTSGSGDLLALAPDGTERWRQTVASHHVRGIAATDSTVFAEPVRANALVALAAADGTERWRLDTPGGVRGPVLAGDRAYLAAGEGDVYALSLE